MSITATEFADGIMLKLVSEAGPLTLFTANLSTYAVTSSYFTTRQKQILADRLRALDTALNGNLVSNGKTAALALFSLSAFQQSVTVSASVAAGVVTVTLSGFLNDASNEYIQISLPHSTAAVVASTPAIDTIPAADAGDFAGAGLVAHYTFVNTTMRVVEDQKGSLDLTVHGYPAAEPGVVNETAFGFNPTNHQGLVDTAWLTHSNATALKTALTGTEWTVSFWARIHYDYYGYGQRILAIEPASGPEYLLLLWDVNHLRLYSNNWNNPSNTFDSVFQDSAEGWHHLVFRYRDGIYLDTWLDGVEVSHAFDFQPYGDGWSGSTGNTKFVLGGGTNLIGAAPASMLSAYSGMLDDIRFYSTALSDAQIATLYGMGA